MIFSRLAFLSVLVAVLGLANTVPLAAAADDDSIDTYQCSNCYEKCGSWLFDFQCNLDKVFCISTVALVDGIMQAGAASCAIEHNENYSDANTLVQQANDLLVEKNLFSQEFLNSVNVYFCKIPPDGMAPTADVVLVKSKFSSTPLLEITKLLAREYYHIYQHKQIGTENLYCQYIEDSIISFNGNPIEKEADDFQEDAGRCIFDAEGCPNAPLI